MTSKNKIILFYAAIAVFAVVIILLSTWLRHMLDQKIQEDFVATGIHESEQFFQIEGDLEATNQDGETVKLSDLNEKVWVITQFFANCPLCAARNDQDLRKIYNEHKDDPNFHLVCVTVDPEKDDVTRLKGYAEALGADSKNWWFLTGPQDKLQGFLNGKMKFTQVSERTDEKEIAAKGRYAHDFGIAVVRPGFVYGTKRDLESARQMGEGFYESAWNLLQAQIEQGKKEANE